MSKIIAIDLGTGNSVVSFWDGQQSKIIENSEGKRTTPSIVALTDKGEWLVGQSAKNQSITNAENTVYEVKRLIGGNWSDPKVQEDIKKFPFKCHEGENGKILITLQGKDYTPEEISAKILTKLKTDAETYLGEKVEKAVITVPAYFNDSQRNSTKVAGKIAGLDVVRIINEPTAASLAYGVDKADTDEKILVYDNGSGTLDVSILEIIDGVFEVKSTSGDTHCGGSDIDKILIDYIAEDFQNKNNIDIRKDTLALQRLKEAAENAKIELSSALETTINLPYITATNAGPVHLNMQLTRAKFENLIESFVKKTLKPIEQALSDAKLSKSDIKEVIMVGGTTRIPYVQKIVQEFFNKELNKSVNPDEVVSVGAGIQSGILQGDGKQDILLLDVTPLSLSIETLGGIATVMIERNTTIPVSKKQVFSTASDNQNAVTVNIAQGERPMFKDNKFLGTFNLEGIAPAPRGVPQIEITYDIDANGILTVKAQDLGTKKEMSTVISGSTKLSDDEIDQMVKEAEKNAEADKQRKQLIEKRNEAESLINAAEKSLKDNSDKISEDIKTSVNEAITTLKDIYNKEDVTVEQLDEKTNNLRDALMAIGEAIYKNQQEATQETTQETTSENNAQDATFTEK